MQAHGPPYPMICSKNHPSLLPQGPAAAAAAAVRSAGLPLRRGFPGSGRCGRGGRSQGAGRAPHRPSRVRPFQSTVQDMNVHLVYFSRSQPVEAEEGEGAGLVSYVCRHAHRVAAGCIFYLVTLRRLSLATQIRTPVKKSPECDLLS